MLYWFSPVFPMTTWEGESSPRNSFVPANMRRGQGCRPCICPRRKRRDGKNGKNDRYEAQKPQYIMRYPERTFAYPVRLPCLWGDVSFYFTHEILKKVIQSLIHFEIIAIYIRIPHYQIVIVTAHSRPAGKTAILTSFSRCARYLLASDSSVMEVSCNHPIYSRVRRMFLYKALILVFSVVWRVESSSFVIGYSVVNAMVDTNVYFFQPASLIYIPYGMIIGVVVCVVSGHVPCVGSLKYGSHRCPEKQIDSSVLVRWRLVTHIPFRKDYPINRKRNSSL